MSKRKLIWNIFIVSFLLGQLTTTLGFRLDMYLIPPMVFIPISAALFIWVIREKI